MSSYMVKDETINTIISAIQRDASLNGEYLTRQIANLGYDLATDKGWAELANDMFELNRIAVDCRYGQGEAEKFRPLDFKYQWIREDKYNWYTAYKRLECWLYQCSEGYVPQMDLFKFFDHRVRVMLANKIIHARPEYEKCAWA